MFEHSLCMQVSLHVRLEPGDWTAGAPLLARRLAALPVAELSLPAQPLLGYDSPGFASGFDPEHAKAAGSLLSFYQASRVRLHLQFKLPCFANVTGNDSWFMQKVLLQLS